MNNDHGASRPDWVIPELGFEAETEMLRQAIADWIKGAAPDMQEMLKWQFLAGSKYFRPLTMFSVARAQGLKVSEQLIRSAVTLELFHNMTLVVDDVLDHSKERRGKATMHEKFGELHALMSSGYMTAETFRMMAGDAHGIELMAELMTRLGVAEVVQWEKRSQPLGVTDWWGLAAEDTGSMFEAAACLADRSEALRRFGGLLGILYHACDDVSDVRGTEALGGGGEEDIRDGILTLPASIAIADPRVMKMFREPKPDNYDQLAEAFRAVLPQAEAKLDEIAEMAKREAKLHSQNPEPLFAIVDQTRKLGRKA